MRYRILVLACGIASLRSAPGQTAQQVSPVLLRITAAQKRVQSNPGCARCYVDLAAALCRQARDTDDQEAYVKAGAALEHALKLAPGDFAAEKLRVVILLGTDRPGPALEAAKTLNKQVPDDIGVWALLADANLALGNKVEAVRDAQWILDLRPGSSLGFEKAAELRAAYGDPEGAAEFYAEANRRTSLNDADEHSWLLSHEAQQQLARGLTAEAASLLQQALQWFPDSQFAARVSAELHSTQTSSVTAIQGVSR